MKEDFLELLEKIVNESDLYALEQLVKSLPDEHISEYKSEISEAYMSIYYYWQYELGCNKIQEGHESDFIFDMIDILDAAETVDPDVMRYQELGSCYELLAEYTPEISQQIVYFQQAIDVYREGVHHSEFVTLNAALAAALLKKMSLMDQFDRQVFTEVISLLDLAYAEYSETVMRTYLYASFDILSMSFEGKEQLHDELLAHFNKNTDTFARKDTLIYLKWSNELSRILYHAYYPMSAEYADELNHFIIAILQHLTDYSTEDTELLNQLGHEFDKAAGRLKEPSSEKLDLYETALSYYVQGQMIQPLAWTFVVYATNVLKEMALIYYARDERTAMIETFERGRQVFAVSWDPDFTLTLNWGRFLIAYAKLAYNFDAWDILKEAEEKLLIAKELGEKGYSDPYILLAKIALKTGDTDTCIALLKECKNIFSNQYSTYSLKDVQADDDFEEISHHEIFQEGRQD